MLSKLAAFISFANWNSQFSKYDTLHRKFTNMNSFRELKKKMTMQRMWQIKCVSFSKVKLHIFGSLECNLFCRTIQFYICETLCQNRNILLHFLISFRFLRYTKCDATIFVRFRKHVRMSFENLMQGRRENHTKKMPVKEVKCSFCASTYDISEHISCGSRCLLSIRAK